MLAFMAALVVVTATAQATYTYPSTAASYVSDSTYMVCNPVCPPPTLKAKLERPVLVAIPVQAPLRITTPVVVAQGTPATAEMALTTPRETRPEETATKARVVYFAYNSARLGQEEKMKLDSWKPLAAAAQTVRITGYTDEVASRKYNDRLAVKRAKAVRKYLGVKAEIKGKGKCCYVDPSDGSKNRRAEIEVTAGESAKEKKDKS